MPLSHSVTLCIKAHVLQCAFASVGIPVAPSVGEVETFVHRWCVKGFSTYQLQAIVDELVIEKYLEVEMRPHGKVKRRTYRITQSGTIYLLGLLSHLHPTIRKGMEDLASRVNNAASVALSSWFEQGVKHG